MESEWTVSREEIVAALSWTWSRLAELGVSLGRDEWDLPTRCPGWTVRDVFSHMIGTESMLAGRPHPTVDVPDLDHLRNDIGRFNEAWVIERRDRAGQDVLAEFTIITGERLAALCSMSRDQFDEEAWTPAGMATYGRFMQIRAFDCWMHEQDVRAALGRPGGLTGAAVRVAFAEMATALGFVVGKRAGAPEGSTVVLAITTPEGRQRFDIVVDGRAKLVSQRVLSPTATVTTDLETFAALVGGRIDPAGPLADGRVKIAGDPDLAERVATHLAFVI